VANKSRPLMIHVVCRGLEDGREKAPNKQRELRLDIPAETFAFIYLGQIVMNCGATMTEVEYACPLNNLAHDNPPPPPPPSSSVFIQLAAQSAAESPEVAVHGLHVITCLIILYHDPHRTHRPLSSDTGPHTPHPPQLCF
jgi:hypothetical protein